MGQKLQAISGAKNDAHFRIYCVNHDVVMFTKRPGEEEKHYFATKCVEAIAVALNNRGLPFALCGDLAFNLYMDREIPKGSSLSWFIVIEIMILSAVDLTRLIDTIARSGPHHFRMSNKILQYFAVSASGVVQTMDIRLSVFVTTRRPQYKATFSELFLIPYKTLLLQVLEEWHENYQQQGDEDAEIRANNLSAKIQRMMKPHLPARFHKGDHLFDRNLFEASLERVEAFIAAYHNGQRSQWSKIGLDPSALYSEQEDPPSPTSPFGGPIVQVFKPSVSDDYGPPAFLAPHQTTLTKLDIIFIAAQSTVRVLHSLGLPCAIFGSLACKLYGNARTPNDVDILVLPGDKRLTQEELKLLIVRADPQNYVLRSAKDPEATYRVLHYRRNIFSSAQMYQLTTKIDLVLPGTMHLPSLPAGLIAWNGDLPVIPFSLLLLHKLQAWDDHLKATERRYTRKVPVDVGDIEWLLSPGRFMDYLKLTIPWGDRNLFTEEFLVLSVERVKDFCFAFPQYSLRWSEIGFETA